MSVHRPIRLVRQRAIGLAAFGLTAIALIVTRPIDPRAAGPIAEARRIEPPASRPLTPPALDGLTSAEITATVAAIAKAGLAGEHARFAFIELKAPAKSSALPQVPSPRIAEAVVFQLDTHRTTILEVDPQRRAVIASRVVTHGRPRIFREEHRAVLKLLDGHRPWRDAVAERIGVDPRLFSVILFPLPPEDARRFTSSTLAALAFSQHPLYEDVVVPVEGLVAYVDTLKRQVVRVVAQPLRPSGTPRKTPAIPEAQPHWAWPVHAFPFEAMPTRGTPAVTMDGPVVRWRDWRMRLGMSAREGVTLHDVHYRTRGAERSVLHSASLAEVAVVYARPSLDWSLRTVFDAATIGLGLAMRPLRVGEDVPANAIVLPVTRHDDQGQPVEVRDAVAIYERVGAPMWTDQRLTVRPRELVIASRSSLGTYTYTVSWVFKANGAIVVEVLAGGQLAVRRVPGSDAAADAGAGASARIGAGARAPIDRSPYGTLLVPQLEGVTHSHLFTFRLDLDVDGPVNDLIEIAVDRTASSAIPSMTRRRLDTEGPRPGASHPSVQWHVTGESIDQPAYALVQGDRVLEDLRAAAPDFFGQTYYNTRLWVTPFAAEERHPGGEFLIGSDRVDGLRRWTRGRSTARRDLVLWYTAAMFHVPRPEEWPAMATQQVTFALEPVGFVRTGLEWIPVK
jgi:primary-amine oxidase